MRLRSELRSASSYSVNCSDGSAAGSWSTAPTSSAASAGSTRPPTTRRPGPRSPPPARRPTSPRSGRWHRRPRAEALEAQRPVVEVGAQGRHHPQPAVGHRQGVGQAVEERPLLVVGGQREQLLELVHDQQQLAALGHDAAHHPVDPPLAGRQLVGETVRSTTATRRSDSASSLNGDAPAPWRPRTSAPSLRPHRRRIRGSSPARTRLDLPLPEPPTTRTSRPRGPLGEPGQDLVDQAVTAEEVLGVGLVERPQRLVGVGPFVDGPADLARQGRYHGGHEVLELRRLRLRQGGGQHLGDRRRARLRSRPDRAPPGERLGHHGRQVPDILARPPGRPRSQREVAPGRRRRPRRTGCSPPPPGRGRCRPRPPPPAPRRPEPPALPTSPPAHGPRCSRSRNVPPRMRRMTT